MKTKDDILKQMDEVIQYFIDHPDNQQNTDHCRNVDKLINLKADLANGDNTESEPSINYDGVLATVPYQLCPKCGGQGTVSKPPYIAGDVHEWVSSAISFTCDLCDGNKMIPQHIVPQVLANDK